jgi:hypothetical protein
MSDPAATSALDRLERYQFWLGKRRLAWPADGHELSSELEVFAGVALCYLSIMLEHSRAIVILARAGVGWATEVNARAILEAWLSLEELLDGDWPSRRQKADLAIAVGILKVQRLSDLEEDKQSVAPTLDVIYGRHPELRDIAPRRVWWNHWSSFRLSDLLKSRAASIADTSFLLEAHTLLADTAHHSVTPARRVAVHTGVVSPPQDSLEVAEFCATLALGLLLRARTRMKEIAGDPMAEWMPPEHGAP